MEISLFVGDSEELGDEMISQRRDFHQHPELGFEEHRTAKIVAESLKKFGLAVQTGVAETGVVGLLEGVEAGPAVLMRFDMDALPLQEDTDAPYSSQVPGVMHACGHDGHTAVGMALARILSTYRSEMRGKIKFVFQPAEEGLGGAERMVAEGVLSNPEPDYALAFHLWNEKPIGWIGIPEGPVMAGAELFEISIRGKGGHGALPHETADPVLAASQVVTALQSVVARNVDPLESAVVSVTQLQAGDSFNVIPKQALLRGTVRTFKPQIRKITLRRVGQIAKRVSEALGCRAMVGIKRLTPPVVNDAALATKIRVLAEDLFPNAVVDDRVATMVSEDMALMMETIPGCYLLIGSNSPKKKLTASHHSPNFDFDEAVLPKAAALMAASAWTLLEGS
ncbi:MAG: amidohydrolase [Anaerolineales bacterium]|nr:amidohydrolase [Anaerolineales bacterium]